MQIAFSLESQIKSFFYSAGPYVHHILQCVFQETQDDLVNIPLKIDFYYIIKAHPNISNILLNQYDKFIKSLNQVIFEIAKQQSMRGGSQYLRNKMDQMTYHDFNCYIQLQNCLIKQMDFKDIHCLDNKFNTQGQLIYLKNYLVIEVSNPELYLYRWVEKVSDCSCVNLVKNIKKNQSMIDVLSCGVLRQRSKQLPQICEFCDRVFQACEIIEKVHLSCQKIKILSLNNQHSKHRHLNNSILQVYVNSHKVNQIQIGDNISLCAYMKNQQKVKIMNQNQKIKIQQSNILLCIQDYLYQQTPHFNFFNSVSDICMEYSLCNSNDYLKLYHNYKQIIQSINEVRFQFSEPKTFTFLKISLLASLFLCHPLSSPHTTINQSLSTLIITDQQNIINRVLKIPFLNFKQFPKVYDAQNINLFLLSCHNSVLIFNNPNKKQFQYVEAAIKGQIGEGKKMIKVNIIVWVIINPLIKPKQIMTLEMFNIILDITFVENINNRQVHHQIKEIIDLLITSYLPVPVFNSGTNKIKRRFRQLADTVERNQKNSKKIQLDASQAIDGLQFLEQYYLTSRQHKKSTVSNLLSLKRVAVGISSMRRYFSKQKGPEGVDFGDALISIFLDEQTSRNKRGNSNTLLANEIAKFMLDEKDQMTINQYVFYEEDFEEVRKTVHKSAVFIRIVDQLKRIVRNKNII